MGDGGWSPRRRKPRSPGPSVSARRSVCGVLPSVSFRRRSFDADGKGCSANWGGGRGRSYCPQGRRINRENKGKKRKKKKKKKHSSRPVAVSNHPAGSSFRRHPRRACWLLRLLLRRGPEQSRAEQRRLRSDCLPPMFRVRIPPPPPPPGAGCGRTSLASCRRESERASERGGCTGCPEWSAAGCGADAPGHGGRSLLVARLHADCLLGRCRGRAAAVLGWSLRLTDVGDAAEQLAPGRRQLYGFSGPEASRNRNV